MRHARTEVSDTHVSLLRPPVRRATGGGGGAGERRRKGKRREGRDKGEAERGRIYVEGRRKRIAGETDSQKSSVSNRSCAKMKVGRQTSLTFHYIMSGN